MFDLRRCSSSFAPVSLLLALGVAGCAGTDTSPEGQTAPSEGDQAAASVTTGAPGTSGANECVLDTLFFDSGFVAELRDAVGPTFVKEYGGNYFPHVVVPHALDAVIDGDEFGNAVDTLNGWDLHQEELPQGSTARPRLQAVLEAGPADGAKLPSLKQRYTVAKGIFDALTRATETTEHHVAPNASYDRSYDRVTRASSSGRVVCTSTVYPTSGDTRPNFACTFTGITQSMFQAFDPKDAGGYCPTR